MPDKNYGANVYFAFDANEIDGIITFDADKPIPVRAPVAEPAHAPQPAPTSAPVAASAPVAQAQAVTEEKPRTLDKNAVYNAFDANEIDGIITFDASKPLPPAKITVSAPAPTAPAPVAQVAQAPVAPQASPAPASEPVVEEKPRTLDKNAVYNAFDANEIDGIITFDASKPLPPAKITVAGVVAPQAQAPAAPQAAPDAPVTPVAPVSSEPIPRTLDKNAVYNAFDANEIDGIITFDASKPLPPVGGAPAPASEPVVAAAPVAQAPVYEEPSPVAEPVSYEEPVAYEEPIAYEEPAPVAAPQYEEPAPIAVPQYEEPAPAPKKKKKSKVPFIILGVVAAVIIVIAIIIAGAIGGLVGLLTGGNSGGGYTDTDTNPPVVTPGEGGGTTTPPEDGGTTTPPDDGGTTTPPDDGGTTTPPDDGDSTTPPDDGGSTTPPDDGGSTTPPDDGGDDPSEPALPEGAILYEDFVLSLEYDYEYYDYVYTVIGYRGNQASIVIPSEYDSVPIVKIGENAFKNCSFSSVEFESVIITIESNAFVNSTIETIYVYSIAKLSENAFNQCEITNFVAFNDITIEEGAINTTEPMYSLLLAGEYLDLSTNITNYSPVALAISGDYLDGNYVSLANTTDLLVTSGTIESISYNNALEYVEIGEFVSEIWSYAFDECYSLAEVAFDDPNGWVAYDYLSDSYITISGLSDPETAALYLTSIYLEYDWYNS